MMTMHRNGQQRSQKVHFRGRSVPICEKLVPVSDKGTALWPEAFSALRRFKFLDGLTSLEDK